MVSEAKELTDMLRPLKQRRKNYEEGAEE